MTILQKDKKIKMFTKHDPKDGMQRSSLMKQVCGMKKSCSMKLKKEF